MAQCFSFTMMSMVKVISWLFYRFDVTWLSKKQNKDLKDVKLMVLLNHTSLFEAMLVRLAPFPFLWKIARHVLLPVADITTNRPLVGAFFHALVPGVVPISRKRDESWHNFLNRVNDDAIVAILPEGRMRRRDGNDKHGKPMTVRGGVAEIIEELEGGNILFVYCGGMHHIQIPGQRFPRPFKTIKVNMEIVEVDSYKSEHYQDDKKARQLNYVADIQSRLESKTPHCEHQPYNKQ